jgi:hypothetical protein
VLTRRAQIIAFVKMLGNFVRYDNPTISSLYANGVTTGNTTFNPVSEWPPYALYDPVLLDWNTTCPETIVAGGLPYCHGGDERNTFRLADAWTWEVSIRLVDTL